MTNNKEKPGGRIPGGVVITRNDVERYKAEFLEETVLVKANEAATVLAVSRRTVYSLVSDGELTPYNNSGGRTSGLRFLAAELKEYVKSMKLDKTDFGE